MLLTKRKKTKSAAIETIQNLCRAWAKRNATIPNIDVPSTWVAASRQWTMVPANGLFSLNPKTTMWCWMASKSMTRRVHAAVAAVAVAAAAAAAVGIGFAVPLDNVDWNMDCIRRLTYHHVAWDQKSIV